MQAITLSLSCVHTALTAQSHLLKSVASPSWTVQASWLRWRAACAGSGWDAYCFLSLSALLPVPSAVPRQPSAISLALPLLWAACAGGVGLSGGGYLSLLTLLSFLLY